MHGTITSICYCAAKNRACLEIPAVNQQTVQFQKRFPKRAIRDFKTNNQTMQPQTHLAHRDSSVVRHRMHTLLSHRPIRCVHVTLWEACAGHGSQTCDKNSDAHTTERLPEHWLARSLRPQSAWLHSSIGFSFSKYTRHTMSLHASAPISAPLVSQEASHSIGDALADHRAFAKQLATAQLIKYDGSNRLEPEFMVSWVSM